jgi:hypothetical protein
VPFGSYKCENGYVLLWRAVTTHTAKTTTSSTTVAPSLSYSRKRTNMLQRKLYRSLLRVGKKFDANPHYKAFIFSSEATFPTDNLQSEFDRRTEIVLANNADQAMKHLVDSFCLPGIFYKPSVSLESTIRRAFRTPLPVELSDVEKDHVGLVALRQLLGCQRLAEETSSAVINADVRSTPSKGKQMVVEPSAMDTVGHSTSSIPLLEPATELEPGVILVAHPLTVEPPLENAVILMTSVAENYCQGLILNHQVRTSFKQTLTRGERTRKGMFLKAFYDCPCFVGGDSKLDHFLNFCIIHQQDHLAGCSTRVDLPWGALEVEEEDVVEAAAPASDAAAAAEPVPSAPEAAEERATAEPAEATATQTNSTGPKDYFYVSQDFQKIGEELTKGTVAARDLKVSSRSVVL